MRQASTEPIHPNARDYFRRGGPDAVLLTHGFTGSPFDLRELADVFHDAGATVLVKRLAGHGTTLRDLANRSLADWRQSLDEAVEQLGSFRSIVLVGNSFGGNLLLDLCQRRALPVRGVVLLSTPIFMPGEWWKRLLLPVILPWKFSVAKSWVKREDRADYLVRGSYVEIPLRGYREFLNVLHGQDRAFFSRFSLPILLVYSTHDSVIKPHSAQFIYQNVASLLKRLYWVNDTHHSPLQSKRKAELYQLILSFFRDPTRLQEPRSMV